MVLNAKDVIVAMETPLERVLVSKISAGMIQDKGPQVELKQKLYSQVTAMKPQEALLFPVDPGGKTASMIVATMKVRQLPRLPPISVQRRPRRSMKAMQNRRDGLVFERISTADTHFFVDGDGVVLNSRDTSHLDRSLESASKEETAET
jgi:hypothetical protein